METPFAEGPIASDSEQFGLARPHDTRLSSDLPSPPDVRPWGLRGMAVGAVRARSLPAFTYCHTQQVAVDRTGRLLIRTGSVDPTADSRAASTPCPAASCRCATRARPARADPPSPSAVRMPATASPLWT